LCQVGQDGDDRAEMDRRIETLMEFYECTFSKVDKVVGELVAWER
jgi:hypothetical protein